MTPWALLIAVVLFSVWVWVAHRRRLKRFNNVDEAGVASAVRLLLDSGYDGATLLLHDMESERFVQFRKYIIRSGEYGIETHFPLASWSQQYYQSVITLLKTKDIPFEILSANVRPTTEFIRVDFGPNVDQAVDWTVGVFIE